MKMVMLLFLMLFVLATVGCIIPSMYSGHSHERGQFDRPCFQCKGSGWKHNMRCDWCKGRGTYP